MNTDVRHRPFFDIAPLLPAIASGAAIVTSNLRLSRAIHSAWRHHCQQQALATWESPNILPLETWLHDCWGQLVAAAWPPALQGIPVSPAQELLLWEQAVATDPDLPPAANPENFASLGRQGWKLLRQWQVQDHTLRNHDGSQYLLRWGKTVAGELQKLAMISSEQRTEQVLEGFRLGVLKPVEQLLLVGFQTLPPLLEATLNSASRRCEHYQPAKKPARRQRLGADSPANELASAAQWAQEMAARHPQARIAVVIPDLTAIQTAVERSFRNRFQPAHCLPQSGYSAAPFNLSAGTPLGQAPVIAAALALLGLLREPLASTDVCRLLTNPFWGNGDSEGDVRCRAQRAVLDLGLHQFSASRLRQLLAPMENDNEGDGIPLHQRLAQLATLLRQQPARQSFAGWREMFSTSLHSLGWPGSRSPDSLEFQQLQQWQEVLANFAAFDRVSPPVKLNEAIARLTRLASDSTFHPQTPDSPVQVLGLLEAAGLEFDYLWLMNMDDRHWPEPTAPHPLLPASLQRQWGMPKASPERELALATALFELFSHSAGEIVFSYAKKDGDIHLQASALLANLPDITLPATGTAHPWQEAIAESSRLDVVNDDKAPAFNPPENRVRGGSRLLADQAQCPFNAFAQWRLGALALGAPQSGLGAQLRGILVHDSLEFFWRQITNHQQLTALGDGERAQLLQRAIAQACNELFQNNPLLQRQDFGERLLQLEQARLLLLLDNWLHIELERPDFAVAASEKTLPLELDGLHLSLRLDRLDRLADGSLAILDYKTGKTTIASVAGERLTEPQLPLYALALQQQGDEPVAVSYANIHRKNLGFDGIAREANILPGCKTLAERNLPESWPETLAFWQENLETLVAELRAGRADVAFYSREAQNYGGHLEPLNRLAGWDDVLAVKALLTRERNGEQP